MSQNKESKKGGKQKQQKEEEVSLTAVDDVFLQSLGKNIRNKNKKLGKI